MSLNYTATLDIDCAPAKKKVDKVDKDLKKLEQKASKAWTRNRATYAYYGQLANILLRNLEQAAAGTERLALIQGLQAGTTAVLGEVAVYQTAMQAAGAFAAGNFMGALALGTISASLQGSIIAALAQKLESSAVAQQAMRIKNQMRSYRQ